MRLAAVASLVGLALPSLAAAQAPGAYDPTPPLAPPGMTPLAGDTDEPPRSAPSLSVVAPPAPELSPIERASRRDAADDRAYGTSTALVVPAGEVDASLRVASIGGLLSVTAGLGGSLEISADVGGVTGMGSYGVGAKLSLVRRYGWAFAVEGGYHKLGDGEEDEVGLYNVGAVVSGCMDRDCSALISLGAGVLGSTQQDESSDSMPYAWGSLLLGTGGFRPIVEGAVLQGGVLGFVGARMGGKHAALDLGVGFLGGDGEGGGLPIAALSVRP